MHTAWPMLKATSRFGALASSRNITQHNMIRSSTRGGFFFLILKIAATYLAKSQRVEVWDLC